MLWQSYMSGDVSLLPECLNVTFQASAEPGGADAADETQWCFFARLNMELIIPGGDNVPTNDFNKSVSYYDEQFATPGNPYTEYFDMLSGIANAFPNVSKIIPNGYTVYGGSGPARALKQASNDVDINCLPGYGGPDVYEESVGEDGWKVTKAECDNVLIAAYKMLDDGVMVFRYPGFRDTVATERAWRNAVNFARENNATKLLFDMIGNGGGLVTTQYFMRLALYPSMDYDDWKDSFAQRISPQLQQIINYIASGSDVISLVNEYRQDLLDALDSDELDELFVSTGRVLDEMWDIITNGVIGTETEESTWLRVVNETRNEFLRIVDANEPATLDAFLQFLSTPDGIITSQIGQYGTQQLFQGGSNVTNTGFFNLWSTPKDFLEAKKEVVNDLPFESYVLLSNGLSGSSASVLEEGVRAYAKKYAGEVTPLTAVSFGCLGEAATCPMTQFSGATLGGGNRQLYAVYSSIPGVFATYQVASILNENGIVQTEGSRAFLEEYINRLGPDFIEPIPDVPFLQKEPASYGFATKYPHAVSTSENVIPMEFLNQPADAVIDLWPRPGSTDAPYDGASLPELYQEASKYFTTREQAAAEPRLEFAPASTLGGASGQEAGNSGVARAFTAALFFLCLLVQ
jgi:hypothetical protein